MLKPQVADAREEGGAAINDFVSRYSPPTEEPKKTEAIPLHFADGHGEQLQSHADHDGREEYGPDRPR